MTDFVRQHPLFSGLNEDGFKLLFEMIEEVRLKKGEVLFAEGDPGHDAYILIEGEVEILKRSGRRNVLIEVIRPGELIGDIALLEQAPRATTAKARTDTILLSLEKEELDQLISENHSIRVAVFQNAITNLREAEDMLQQGEKKAQLSTLVAGIAHELNNPTAAISRGRDLLGESLQALIAHMGQLHSTDLADKQMRVFLELEKTCALKAKEPVELNALARSDRSDELISWAHQHKELARIDEYIGDLIDLDLDPKELDELSKDFKGKQLEYLLLTAGSMSRVYQLMEEIGKSASRLSEVIASLKSYSYLDQAPTQLVDIHNGIDETLLIFSHRIKEGVSVLRDYEEDLPQIIAHGSELNQVWTNIIDNALDALSGSGEIIIRTRREGEWIVVEFEDNGPGIPEDVQSNIFDPFFTTKTVGEGTGLGLHISYNIIADKHNGDIRVESKPGKTVFLVRLPIYSNSDE